MGDTFERSDTRASELSKNMASSSFKLLEDVWKGNEANRSSFHAGALKELEFRDPPHHEVIVRKQGQELPPLPKETKVGSQDMPPQPKETKVGSQDLPPQPKETKIGSQDLPPQPKETKVGSQDLPPQPKETKVGSQDMPPKQIEPKAKGDAQRDKSQRAEGKEFTHRMTAGDGSRVDLDDKGRVMGFVDKQGREFKFKRDAKGNIIETSGPNGTWTTKDGKHWTNQDGYECEAKVEVTMQGKPGDGTAKGGSCTYSFTTEGGKRTYESDGTTKSEVNGAKGDQVKTTTEKPDGTVIQEKANGDKVTTLKNGVIIEELSDGRKITKANGWETTQYPPNTFKYDGMVESTKSPDGVVRSTYRNGNTVTDYPAGKGAKQVIECKPPSEVAKVATSEDGRVYVTRRAPNGSVTQESYNPGEVTVMLGANGEPIIIEWSKVPNDPLGTH